LTTGQKVSREIVKVVQRIESLDVRHRGVTLRDIELDGKHAYGTREDEESTHSKATLKVGSAKTKKATIKGGINTQLDPQTIETLKKSVLGKVLSEIKRYRDKANKLVEELEK